jgi:hypothetical protein
VSPTDRSLTITTTAWQNLHFKEQITIVGLSGIALQIWQLDFNLFVSLALQPIMIVFSQPGSGL